MNAKLEGNRIKIYDGYLHKETIKEIYGRRWHTEEKAWSIPFTSDNLITLQMIGCKITEELQNRIKQISKKEKLRDVPLVPVEPMPIRTKPYSHQIEGYNLICMALGIFLGGGVA